MKYNINEGWSLLWLRAQFLDDVQFVAQHLVAHVEFVVGGQTGEEGEVEEATVGTALGHLVTHLPHHAINGELNLLLAAQGSLERGGVVVPPVLLGEVVEVCVHLVLEYGVAEEVLLVVADDDHRVVLLHIVQDPAAVHNTHIFVLLLVHLGSLVNHTPRGDVLELQPALRPLQPLERAPVLLQVADVGQRQQRREVVGAGQVHEVGGDCDGGHDDGCHPVSHYRRQYQQHGTQVADHVGQNQAWTDRIALQLHRHVLSRNGFSLWVELMSLGRHRALIVELEDNRLGVAVLDGQAAVVVPSHAPNITINVRPTKRWLQTYQLLQIFTTFTKCTQHYPTLDGIGRIGYSIVGQLIGLAGQSMVSGEYQQQSGLCMGVDHSMSMPLARFQASALDRVFLTAFSTQSGNLGQDSSSLLSSSLMVSMCAMVACEWLCARQQTFIQSRALTVLVSRSPLNYLGSSLGLASLILVSLSLSQYCFLWKRVNLVLSALGSLTAGSVVRSLCMGTSLVPSLQMSISSPLICALSKFQNIYSRLISGSSSPMMSSYLSSSLSWNLTFLRSSQNRMPSSHLTTSRFLGLNSRAEWSREGLSSALYLALLRMSLRSFQTPRWRASRLNSLTSSWSSKSTESIHCFWKRVQMAGLQKDLQMCGYLWQIIRQIFLR